MQQSCGFYPLKSGIKIWRNFPPDLGWRPPISDSSFPLHLGLFFRLEKSFIKGIGGQWKIGGSENRGGIFVQNTNLKIGGNKKIEEKSFVKCVDCPVKTGKK